MTFLEISQSEKSMFEDLTLIELKLDESLPSKVCYECLNKLNNLHLYK